MKSNADEQINIMYKRVLTNLLPYQKLMLAFSGGLDSTVLLDILTTLRNENKLNSVNTLSSLRAVHVHHALNQHADDWVVHCAHECHQRNVDFNVIHIVVDKVSHGIEAGARHARYKALKMALKQGEVLLTAQHQDDQVETFFLALKRGSGPLGLSAMMADMSFLGSRLVRPLINFSKENLELYAKARNLSWIKDDSNNDIRFDRNFLRLNVLPFLKKRWPQFSKTVARSAKLCAEQEHLIDELLAETLSHVIASDGSLNLIKLSNMSTVKRSALLRRWLAKLGVKMPTYLQLTYLWKEVALSRRDAIAQFKLDGKLLRRFHNHLYIVPNVPSFTNKKIIFPWPKKNEFIALPAGLGFIYRFLVNTKQNQSPKDNFPVNIKFSKNINENHGNNGNNKKTTYASDSDVYSNTNIVKPFTIVRAPLCNEKVSVRFGTVHGLLYILGRSRGRKLKKIWQELNVPPWKRSSTPLLFYNDQLIAALGIFVTYNGAVNGCHTQWWLFCQPENKNHIII